MAKDLDRLLRSLSEAEPVEEASCWRPRADLIRSRRGWLIKIELAGVHPEDVSVHITGDTLTVAGVRRDVVLDAGASIHSMEIAYSRFQRSFRLGCSIDRDRIETQYDNGMLLILVQPES